MNKTPIQWTDFTVNPFRFRNLETGKVGHYCAKISPGCKNCYSDKMQGGPYLSGLTFIAENKPRGEFFLDEGALQQVLRRKKPCRIFWCDMTDMFLEDYPDEWIDRCFAAMALTPHITHQVLTKRAQRRRGYLTAGRFQSDARVRIYNCAALANPSIDAKFQWPLPNVWLGVSVEDRARKDRIDLLRKTPALVRFLSLEPLLEDLGQLDLSGIHWVIIGGESGPKARMCDVAWIRSIVEQCRAAGVPCFVKQLGTQPMSQTIDHGVVYAGSSAKPPQYRLLLYDCKGGDISEWPADLRVREFPAI
jgi:protein gp37